MNPYDKNKTPLEYLLTEQINLYKDEDIITYVGSCFFLESTFADLQPNQKLFIKKCVVESKTTIAELKLVYGTVDGMYTLFTNKSVILTNGTNVLTGYQYKGNIEFENLTVVNPWDVEGSPLGILSIVEGVLASTRGCYLEYKIITE